MGSRGDFAASDFRGFDLSVVIPTHNRRGLLLKLLDALGQQTFPLDRFEVVVVDDGSQDGTIDLLESLKTPFSLITHHQKQSGVARARNQGIELASGEIILCLDDDVIPVPDLLNEHAFSHSQDENAVVIGHLTPDYSAKRAGWTKWGEMSIDKRFADLADNRRPVVGRDLYSGNFSARRTHLQAVGGFDEKMPLVEDGDLGCRLEEFGVRMYYNAKADVVHCGEQTGRGWLNRCYQFGRMDVFLSQAKANSFGLNWMLDTLVRANPFTRSIVKVALDHRTLASVMIGMLWRLANLGNHFGLFRWVVDFYSAIAIILYWQGVSDEMGGKSTFWRAYDEYVHSSCRRPSVSAVVD